MKRKVRYFLISCKHNDFNIRLLIDSYKFPNEQVIQNYLRKQKEHESCTDTPIITNIFEFKSKADFLNYIASN